MKIRFMNFSSQFLCLKYYFWKAFSEMKEAKGSFYWLFTTPYVYNVALLSAMCYNCSLWGTNTSFVGSLTPY